MGNGNVQRRSIELGAATTVNGEWSNFSKAIFSHFQPSMRQYTEMKKSFYTGAYAMLATVIELGERSEEEAISKLEALKTECESYFAAVLKEDEDRMRRQPPGACF